jgi:3-oxoacyl-[acyl-carrier protein] reductase
MELNLNGKTALVCGSTQGIGRSSAQELAKLGARIVLMARDSEKLQVEKAVVDQLNGLNNEILVADFSRWEEVRQVVQDYTATGKQINILVNNNGGPAAGPITEAKPEAFLAAFTQHLLCSQVIVQSVLPGMISSGYGRIINVISTSVKMPLHGLGVSNTIRAAVGNWSKTLANEVGKYGITVNNVLPGATMTGRLEQIIKNKAEKSGKSIAEVEAEMLGEIPMKRFARPEEIAWAVCYLASPAAAYVNGINIPVDGGRTGNL